MNAQAPPTPTSVRYDSTPPCVVLTDQRALPSSIEEIFLTDISSLVEAIHSLAVRGAPAIGIAGSFGILLEPFEEAEGALDALARIREAAGTLGKARPTAINLRWGLNRMVARADALHTAGTPLTDWRAVLLSEAKSIAAEDALSCRRMGELGAELFQQGTRVLTICHTGALCTGGIGTALACVHVAAERGLDPQVFACETRPLLQGARLTSWECMRHGISVHLLPDSAAASLMSAGKIDLVIAGSDRIAANGDTANKIGTYSLAVLAKHHGLPFWIVAPASTYDPKTPDGSAIPIEQRDGDELRHFGQRQIAPLDVPVYNPAFDVTPWQLITGFITEHGRVKVDGPDALRKSLQSAVG